MAQGPGDPAQRGSVAGPFGAAGLAFGELVCDLPEQGTERSIAQLVQLAFRDNAFHYFPPLLARAAPIATFLARRGIAQRLGPPGIARVRAAATFRG